MQSKKLPNDLISELRESSQNQSESTSLEWELVLMNHEEWISQHEGSKPHQSLSQKVELSAEDLDQGLSVEQKFILQKLTDRWFDAGKMVEKLVDVAQNATIPNPVTWEPEINYKLQSDVTIKLMEMTGMYKKKSDATFISLTQIVYGKK